MKKIKRLRMGEHFVSSSKDVVSTVLGSCISVCLYDEESNINGMNHFMLPKQGYDRKHNSSFSYGEHSLPHLISHMIDMGANKESIKAKIFGGSRILSTKESIGQKNIDFIKEFLKGHNIPIVNEDIGGKVGRHIYFDTNTKKVFVKNLK